MHACVAQTPSPYGRYAFLNIPPGTLPAEMTRGEGAIEYLRGEFDGWSDEVLQPLTLPYLTLPYLTLPYLTSAYHTVPCLTLP